MNLNEIQTIRLKLETSKTDVQYIDSNISIPKVNWDDKKQLIKRNAIEEQLNAQLNSLLQQVKSIYYQNPGY